jgi:hypothetical protein
VKPMTTWRSRKILAISKLVDKVLNLRADSKRVNGVLNFRHGKKDFHNSFTFDRRQHGF